MRLVMAENDSSGNWAASVARVCSEYDTNADAGLLGAAPAGLAGVAGGSAGDAGCNLNA